MQTELIVGVFPSDVGILGCLFHAVSILVKFFFYVFGQDQNLSNRPYETVNALEEHGENTVSSVLYLILECLGRYSSASP